MQVRLSEHKNLEKIMSIFDEAKKFIASYGSNQWQGDEYPSKGLIISDINSSSSYVLEDDENIVGYMYISFGKEKCYEIIKSGKWESDFEYMTIHRLALSDKYRGNNLSKLLFDFAENLAKEKNIRSVRIDTHNMNLPLKSILKKRRYKKCGIIFLENGEERQAYEKLIIPFLVNDKVELRKSHPCGCNIFDIKRIGMDIKLECTKCNAQIWLSRAELEKRLKKRLN